MYEFNEYVTKRDDQQIPEVVKEVIFLANEEQFNELLGAAALGGAAMAAPWALNKVYNKYQQSQNPAYQPKTLGQRLGGLTTGLAQGAGKIMQGVGNIGKNYQLGRSGLVGKLDVNDPMYQQKIKAYQAGLVNISPNDPKFNKALDSVVNNPNFEFNLQKATASKLDPTSQQQYWQQQTANYGARGEADKARNNYQQATNPQNNYQQATNPQALLQSLTNVVQQSAMTKSQKAVMANALQKMFAGSTP